jgi:hypothetical protein
MIEICDPKGPASGVCLRALSHGHWQSGCRLCNWITATRVRCAVHRSTGPLMQVRCAAAESTRTSTMLVSPTYACPPNILLRVTSRCSVYRLTRASTARSGPAALLASVRVVEIALGCMLHAVTADEAPSSQHLPHVTTRPSPHLPRVRYLWPASHSRGMETETSPTRHSCEGLLRGKSGAHASQERLRHVVTPSV